MDPFAKNTNASNAIVTYRRIIPPHLFQSYSKTNFVMDGEVAPGPIGMLAVWC
jgi:hypothetical protein